jgi:hypothetical protein
MLHLEDSMFSFLQTVRLHKQPPYEEEYLPMASTSQIMMKSILVNIHLHQRVWVDSLQINRSKMKC